MSEQTTDNQLSGAAAQLDDVVKDMRTRPAKMKEVNEDPDCPTTCVSGERYEAGAGRQLARQSIGSADRSVRRRSATTPCDQNGQRWLIGAIASSKPFTG